MRKPHLPFLLSLIPLATCLAGAAIPATAQNPSAAQKKPLPQAQLALKYHGPIQIQHIPPVLTLTAAPQIAYPNQIIQFTLKWNGPVSHYTYHFDWGDGQIAVVTNPDAVPPHQYSQPRQYIVSVTATPIAFGHTAAAVATTSARARVVILPQPPPPVNSTLTLRPSNSNPGIGESVTFTASLSPADPNAQYTYDFGDGIKKSGTQIIEHSYNSARTYYPAVIAFTSDGQQLAASGAVTITVVVPPPENAGGQEPGSPGQDNTGGSGKSKRPHEPPSQVNPVSDNQPYPPHRTDSNFHWLWPAVSAATLSFFILVLLVGSKIRRWRDQRIERREAASQQPKAQIPASKFKYVPVEGSSAHEFRMVRSKHNSVGPFTLSSGMNRAENTIRFQV
jgi:PKD repeat protein